MKSLSLTTCVALILCTACTKIIDKPIASNSFSAKTSQSFNKIENLGTAITGTNIFWKVNPANENGEPFFTPLPYSNSGFSLLMIDNGNRGTTPLRFIAVDLQNKTSKTIRVTDKNGVVINTTLGRVSRYMYGKNKKFYVATENGGHLIEYDPYTQQAIDLGQPFKIDGNVFDIYSLNVGKDGALYGGSFGGRGDVYTFRYDYVNFVVDKANIDDESRYVTYVAGDEKYTYASCGQNSWKLYGIERATGKKSLLLSSTNPAARIFTTSNTDGCYAQFEGGHYKLNGSAASLMSIYDKPGPGVEYIPYALNNPNLPKVVWSEMDRKVYFKFPGGTEDFVKVNDVIEEVYSTTLTTSIDDKLFITGGTIPKCVTYDPVGGFTQMGGTNIGVFSMAVVPGSGGKKLVMGGYPKGAVMQYDMNRNWNVGIETITTTPPDIFSTASNPHKITQLQDADNSGIFGPMTINGIFYTRDGSLVASGNNDRLTTSASRELGIGTFKNGTKRNYSNEEIRNYEASSMFLSQDSAEVYIGASSKYTNQGKIFKYNPVSNSITSVINFPDSKDPGIIKLFKKDLAIGAYSDIIYLMDLNSKKIIWKSVLGSGQRITAVSLAPDGSVWLVHNSTDLSSKILKYDFETQNVNAITAKATEVTVMKNPDLEEGNYATGLTFMKSAQSSSFDLYISGFKSLCRIKNVIN